MLGDNVKQVSEFTQNFTSEELAKMVIRARKEKLEYKEKYEKLYKEYNKLLDELMESEDE